MLVLDAEICLDTLEVNPNALPHDVSTNVVLRPAINFGNDMLFSGTLVSNNTVASLIRGIVYEVVIELPTIEREAFCNVEKLLMVGGSFTIQNASRVIGRGKILDFKYD
jgi:hypothetical protein